MKNENDLDLSQCYYILFAANMSDSVGLRLSDADYRDWTIFARRNYNVKIGLFALWNEFLASRGLDLCPDCWHGCCRDEVTSEN